MEPAYAKIYPPIGIARVGDSEEEWFLGPEFSDDVVASQHRYRDQTGRLKRQGARFRLIAFDKNDDVIGELTSSDASITWSVELANKKAAWFPFRSGPTALRWFEIAIGTTEQKLFETALELGLEAPRNPSVGLKLDPKGHPGWVAADRKILEIAGSASIHVGAGDHSADSLEPIDGEFCGKPVKLGALRRDENGRLIVLGGHGRSEATGLNGADRWIGSYANNDGWFDDVSDGPISAAVQLRDGRKVEVRGGAWVIVGPPDFAPATKNLVTAFDVMDEICDHFSIARPKELPARPAEAKVEFWHDVFPILARLDGYSWVSDTGLRGHGFSKPGAVGGKVLKALADPDDTEGKAVRATIGRIVRKPFGWFPDEKPTEADRKLALQQANHRFMPPLSGNEGDTTDGLPGTWLSLTPRQYLIISRWADGDFITGRRPASNAKARKEVKQRDLPPTLTRAALDACVGGAFYPGIEITSIMKSRHLYKEAFRIDHARIKAGDITKWMACPWQADFYECQMHWWPGQRPDAVVRGSDFEAALKNFPEETQKGALPSVLFPRTEWGRGLGKARPSIDGLREALISEPGDAERTSAMLSKVRITDVRSAVLYRVRKIWDDQILPSAAYPIRETTQSNPRPEFPDRLPSPWRLQYLLQETVDLHSSLYFSFHVPRPEAAQIKELPPSDGWQSFSREEPGKAANVLSAYCDAVLDRFEEMVGKLLDDATKQITTEILAKILTEKPPTNADPDLGLRRRLALRDLLTTTADGWYLLKKSTAGDMDMVQYWARHGIVTPAPVSEDKPHDIAFVETERAPFDGLDFGDYFHIFQNPESYTGLTELAQQIADRVLDGAQKLIDDTANDSTDFIETAFKYSQDLFDAKMEEIYEYYRYKAQISKPWAANATRNERIQGILRLAPFNQLDGAWLRFIADAGETDDVHSLLFEVWQDEVGNGNPSEHHGNLYTNLMNSLGILLPDTADSLYVEKYPFSDAGFVSPVFELAISSHSKKYLPEILGMTLFLEWEVLELAPGVQQMDYLGIDSKFYRMHVGIDNAVDGHGAKAKAAVKEFLARTGREGGDAAVQEVWQRIWRGFVAFAAPLPDYLGDEDAVAARLPKLVEERLIAMIEHKRSYANRNHGAKRLGGERLNDLFDYPAELLQELANSSWVVPGRPDESRLLTYLTTYSGPMYKVFDARELALWAEWIVWLGKTGDTGRPKEFIGRGEAMLRLLELMRSGAIGSSGHTRHRMKGRPLADWFDEPDLRKLMKVLRKDDSGWVVAGDASASGLVVDQLRVDRPMGRALDRRFPELQNRIGRLVIVEWIDAGCPIPGEEEDFRQRPKTPPASLKPEKKMFVHAFGQGHVH